MTMGIRWDEIVAMPRPLRVQYLGAIYKDAAPMALPDRTVVFLSQRDSIQQPTGCRVGEGYPGISPRMKSNPARVAASGFALSQQTMQPLQERGSNNRQWRGFGELTPCPAR